MQRDGSINGLPQFSVQCCGSGFVFQLNGEKNQLVVVSNECIVNDGFYLVSKNNPGSAQNRGKMQPH